MSTLVAIGSCMGAPAYFRDYVGAIKQVNSIDEAYQVIDSASIIMYGGGEDISPSLYNEPHNPRTYAPRTPSKRDLLEKTIFEIGEQRGAKHYGICRGAQLLAALNGGRLFQHVNNHHTSHKVELHVESLFGNPLRNLMSHSELAKLVSNSVLDTTSVHHQAVDITSLADKYEVYPLLENKCLSQYYELGTTKLTSEEVQLDNEAYFIPELKIFGVQGHPEFDSPDSPFVLFCQTMMSVLTRMD